MGEATVLFWRNVVQITRKVEFDAGHRIPDHASKCRNIHGHRYVLEATLTGNVIKEPGRADTGMVVDFGFLKEVMVSTICEPWDHAFLVYKHDDQMLEALKLLPPDHKTVILPFVPTVENLARVAFTALDMRLRGGWGNLPGPKADMMLSHVRLYETPNCWADYGV
jgi:6-pyruvoyltetrahydropterin/6-carboxytetrahydropterin synthase